MHNLVETTFGHNCAEYKRESMMPKLSIGLPVFNGDNYLEQSLNSILGQSFRDFELIISDNGSTDKTEAICRRYAKTDNRIKYERYNQNKGASWNFNHVLDVAEGKYFKWAAHDDLIDPYFLEESVNILDKDPMIVLCYSGSNIIDENDQVIRKVPVNENLNHELVHQRFAACWRYPPNLVVFGVVRTENIRKTHLLGPYSSSDRILTAELVLQGRLYGIPKYLFSFRQHSQQSTGDRYPTRKVRGAWFDPANKDQRSYPHWRLLREYIYSISNSEIGTIQRVFCYRSLLRWMVRYSFKLAEDLAI